jgi:hypothetical protein
MAATFVNKDWKEIARTPCEVYTRVMGYLRPVSNYNVWKKSEFYSRKYFEESKVDNSQFLRKFGTCPCEYSMAA